MLRGGPGRFVCKVRRILSNEFTHAFYSFEFNRPCLESCLFDFSGQLEFILSYWHLFSTYRTGSYFFLFSLSYFVSEKVFSKYLLTAQTLRLKKFTILTSAFYFLVGGQMITIHAMHCVYIFIQTPTVIIRCIHSDIIFPYME